MIYSVFLWRKGFRRDDRVNYFLLLLGFVLHTSAMFQRGFSLSRCPVNNLYEATIFIAWTIVATCLVVGLLPKLRFLGVFAAPLLFAIGVFALFPALDATYKDKPVFRSGWESLHAAMILLAYGAFGLASVSAAMFLTQHRNLKFHKMQAVLSLLPPIQRLDQVMVGLLISGIVLLTGGLSLSPILLHAKYGVYYKADPVLTYSALIWLAYTGLLAARWRFNQRGQRFAWCLVTSFIFILLTFWGILLLSPVHRT